MDNPGAFVDVYGVYGALIGSALEIDRDSLDHAIVDYNTKINEWRNQTEHPQNLRMTGLSNLLRKGSSSGGGGGTDYGGIVGGIISLFGKNKPGEPGVDKGGNPINTQG